MSISSPPVLRDREVHVWLLSLDFESLMRPSFVGLLDSKERDRAARFHFDHDRDRFIAGRALQRILLSAYCCVEPVDVSYEIGETGKLSILAPGESSLLAFNFSRSGAYGLVAVGRVSAIGVDLESVDNRPGLDDIAANHFSERELEDIAALAPHHHVEAFYCCWTRKEAVVKALGGGLTLPLQHFVVSVDPEEPAALLSLDGSVESAEKWTLLGFRPMTGHWAALAVPKLGIEVRYFSPAVD